MRAPATAPVANGAAPRAPSADVEEGAALGARAAAIPVAAEAVALEGPSADVPVAAVVVGSSASVPARAAGARPPVVVQALPVTDSGAPANGTAGATFTGHVSREQAPGVEITRTAPGIPPPTVAQTIGNDAYQQRVAQQRRRSLTILIVIVAIIIVARFSYLYY